MTARCASIALVAKSVPTAALLQLVVVGVGLERGLCACGVAGARPERLRVACDLLERSLRALAALPRLDRQTRPIS